MRHRATAALAIATASVIAAMVADAAIGAWQSRDLSAPGTSALAGTGIVTGVIVTDTADLQPVRRATVRLSGDGSTPRLVGTNDEGRFVFDRLPPGRFTVSATKAGFVQGFHGSTRPGRGPGVPVAIADGQSVEITIRLLPGAAVSGAIRDARGDPVPGVTVAAVDTRPSGGPAAAASPRAISDDRGVYRIFGLAPGEYVVSAIPQVRPAPVLRGVRPDSAVVTAVTEEDVQRARADGATADVGAASRDGAGSAASLDRPGRPVAYAPVFYPGTTDPAAAATIRVGSGEERTNVDMSLQVVALARLAGTLVDGSGQPVSSATVSLVPKRGDQPSLVDALVAAGAIALPRAAVSAAGFAFSGVAPGQYTLIARTGSGQRGTVAAEAAAPTQWSVMDVTVDGADRTDLALRLLPGLAVSGRYVFEGTAPPPVNPAALNLSFQITDALPGMATTYRAAVQPDGTFRVASLAPGGYVVRADSPAESAARWSLKSAVVDGRDLADHPLAAAADGAELSGVVVTFTDRAAGISGRIIDASGQPITRFSIVVVTSDRSLWLPHARRIRVSQPATDGSFVVRGLPPGEYAIAAVVDLEDADLSDPAFLSDLLATSFTLTLAEGEQKVQNLRGQI